MLVDLLYMLLSVAIRVNAISFYLDIQGLFSEFYQKYFPQANLILVFYDESHWLSIDVMQQHAHLGA